MSTLSITSNSAATFVAPLNLASSSDATFVAPLTIASSSDATFSKPFLSINSDATFFNPFTPPVPPPAPPQFGPNPRLCATRITCPGTDNPILNISAETSDGPEFGSIQWASVDPSQNDNPINQGFFASGCLSICESQVSQDDADICAQNQSFLCQHTNPTTGQVYAGIATNTAQSATVNCPDGNPFTFTVAAGTFYGINLFQANAQALGYAKSKAAQRMICIGSLPATMESGAVINQPVTASGNLSPFPYADFWEISGDLPDGLTFNGGFVNYAQDGPPTITGTVVDGGIFTFYIKVTNWLGDTMQKQFTITVPNYTVTPDIFSSTVSYFNSGASFPAGIYIISYVTGAYLPASSINFYYCVNAQYPPPYTPTLTGYYIVFGGGQEWYSGPFTPAPFFPNESDCFAANQGFSNTINHSGGPIGMYLLDGYYPDNLPGSPNPTFSLVQIA
jgi:hypothetical protein